LEYYIKINVGARQQMPSSFWAFFIRVFAEKGTLYREIEKEVEANGKEIN
jgi:hypothetical protein